VRVPNRAWARSTASLASPATMLGASSSQSAGRAGEVVREVGGDPVGRAQRAATHRAPARPRVPCSLSPDVHPHTGEERARGQQTLDERV
jgi:hypothetical protein